jgi:hypothetical protein
VAAGAIVVAVMGGCFDGIAFVQASATQIQAASAREIIGKHRPFFIFPIPFEDRKIKFIIFR